MSQHSYTAEAMWDRFIERLNEVRPLVFKRDEPALPHKSFLGSIEKYKAIFLEANVGHEPELVPSGWKLVPHEPTEEMIDAGVEQYNRMAYMKDYWQAMWHAAPSPDATHGESGSVG